MDDIGHVWKLVAAWSSFKSPPANHQLVIQTPPNIHKIPSAKACQSCFAQKKNLSELYLVTVPLNLWTSSWYIHISTLSHRPLHKPHMKSRPLQSHPSSFSPHKRQLPNEELWWPEEGWKQSRANSRNLNEPSGSGPGEIGGQMTPTNTVDWNSSGELPTSCYNKLSY